MTKFYFIYIHNRSQYVNLDIYYFKFKFGSRVKQ